MWNFCARFSDVISPETSGSVPKCRLFSQATFIIALLEYNFSFACILLQLIFEGTRGDNAQGDIALDDVKLVEGPC